MGKPIVAIVGRPNVGKSTLFNKLVGQRLAIVEDTPGVTRDRLYGNCEWQDHRFLLIDTGGIEPKADDVLLRHMRGQAQLAIDTADAILFVTDIRSGVTAQDQDIAAMLMRSGKPVFLVVNKVDGVGEPPMELYDFYSLGIGEPYPVSSVHGHGTGDLLEAVCACLPENEDGEDEDERIGVAVIGRPNVGKSSLVNHILGEERMIVANEAGTTRDAVDSDVDNRYGKFTVFRFASTVNCKLRQACRSVPVPDTTHISHCYFFSIALFHIARENAGTIRPDDLIRHTIKVYRGYGLIQFLYRHICYSVNIDCVHC